MKELLSETFEIIGWTIPIVPATIGIVKFKRFDLAFKAIVCMVLVETIISFYSSWQSSQGINNLPSLHLLTISEYLFASVFFHQVFIFQKWKKLVIVLAIIFAFAFTINDLFYQDIYTYNSHSRGLQSLLLCFLSMLYFYQLIRLEVKSLMTDIPEFWVVTAFLIFFSFIELISLFLNYLLLFPQIAKTLFVIIRVASIIYYPLLAVGLWKKSLK